MFQTSFSEYLSDEMYIDDRKRQNIVYALVQEMNGRGIKNVELAELTGWSTSKVSKLLSGKQNFTDDDLRTCARALGYTLDPFIDQGVDTRGYDVRKFVRSPINCIDLFLGNDESHEVEVNASFIYELPLSVLGLLGVRISDYAVRTHITADAIRGDEEENCSWIKIWNRNIKASDYSYPVLSIWVDSSRDRFAVLVYLDGDSNSLLHEVVEERATLRGVHNNYDFLMKEDASDHWLPEKILSNTLSYDYYGKDSPFPDDASFQEILAEIFKDYCDIVWDLKHIDLIPETAIFSNPVTPVEKMIMKTISKDLSFPNGIVENTLKAHDYCCEIDSSHKTFLTPKGHQFAEAAPLIPFEEGTGYGKGVTDGANILCLCPNCAARLKFGSEEDREEMIIKLYRLHRRALEDAGIKVTLGEILRMHKL